MTIAGRKALSGAEVRALRAAGGGRSTLRPLTRSEVIVLIISPCIECAGDVIQGFPSDQVPENPRTNWLCVTCADF